MPVKRIKVILRKMEIIAMTAEVVQPFAWK